VGPGRAKGALIRALSELDSLAMFLVRACRECEGEILPIFVLAEVPIRSNGRRLRPCRCRLARSMVVMRFPRSEPSFGCRQM
jgi:hypothetical protein